jgi:hypothetical protein
MDTVNVIRAEEGEHWLVGADVMTIYGVKPIGCRAARGEP